MSDSSQKKDKIDARKFMEKAIEMIANQSMNHARTARSVLMSGLQDGSFEVASRGELRYGDHAEFTL